MSFDYKRSHTHTHTATHLTRNFRAPMMFPMMLSLSLLLICCVHSIFFAVELVDVVNAAVAVVPVLVVDEDDGIVVEIVDDVL